MEYASHFTWLIVFLIIFYYNSSSQVELFLSLVHDKSRISLFSKFSTLRFYTCFRGGRKSKQRLLYIFRTEFIIYIFARALLLN